MIEVLENLILSGLAILCGFGLYRGLKRGIGLYGDDDRNRNPVLFWIGMATCLLGLFLSSGLVISNL